MSWLVLVLSGVLEAVWATALSRSAGLTRLAPALVFAVALVTAQRLRIAARVRALRAEIESTPANEP